MKSYRYFSAVELRCRCGKCDGGEMGDAFMGKVIAIREVVGPLIVVSGFRCPAHNSNEASTGLEGPHTTGRALDLKAASSSARFAIMREAMNQGMTRFGVNRTSLHIDDLGEAEGFAEDVLWHYYALPMTKKRSRRSPESSRPG